MSKLWKVIKHEYIRHVLRKRFLLALVSVPLWILFSLAMGVVSVILQTNHTPVGYVDPSGIITTTALPESQSSMPSISRVSFRSYSNEDQARAALEHKQIQGFFVLPPDYRQTRSVRLVFLQEPSSTVTRQFSEILKVNLLAGQPANITQRIMEGANIEIQATQEDRSTSKGEWFKIAAPIIAGIFLIVSVFTSSGYLMQAVVEEKENRTMEILATSLSPEQIMGGKTIALIGVGLTQVLVWVSFPLTAVILARAYVPFLQQIEIDTNLIALIALTAVPTFVMIAALMATIGATVTEAREGQQVSGLLTLPVMLPYMLSTVIVMNPNGPLAVFLSLFPLTAAMTLLMRLGFATVPGWQIAASTVILILSAAGSLWLSGRVFRAGMLRYGKRMGWKDVFGALQFRRSNGHVSGHDLQGRSLQ